MKIGLAPAHAADKRGVNTVAQASVPFLAQLAAVCDRGRAAVAAAHRKAQLEHAQRDKVTRSMVARGQPPGQGWRYWLDDEIVALEAALEAALDAAIELAPPEAARRASPPETSG